MNIPFASRIHWFIEHFGLEETWLLKGSTEPLGSNPYFEKAATLHLGNYQGKVLHDVWILRGNIFRRIGSLKEVSYTAAGFSHSRSLWIYTSCFWGGVEINTPLVFFKFKINTIPHVMDLFQSIYNKSTQKKKMKEWRFKKKKKKTQTTTNNNNKTKHKNPTANYFEFLHIIHKFMFL